MANRQTYVIGALGVLAGMVIGANSAQRADMTVSYLNPNNVQTGVPRTVNAIPSLRSDEGITYRTPRRSPFGDNVIGNIRDERLSRLFGSAPLAKGVPVLDPYIWICPGDSRGPRYARCVDAYRNDKLDTYERTYYYNE